MVMVFQQCNVYIKEKFGDVAEATAMVEDNGKKIISYYLPNVVGISEEIVTDLEWDKFIQNQKNKADDE